MFFCVYGVYRVRTKQGLYIVSLLRLTHLNKEPTLDHHMVDYYRQYIMINQKSSNGRCVLGIGGKREVHFRRKRTPSILWYPKPVITYSPVALSPCNSGVKSSRSWGADLPPPRAECQIQDLWREHRALFARKSTTRVWYTIRPGVLASVEGKKRKEKWNGINLPNGVEDESKAELWVLAWAKKVVCSASNSF